MLAGALGTGPGGAGAYRAAEGRGGGVAKTPPGGGAKGEETPEAKLCKLEEALRPASLPLGEVVPLVAALLSLPLPASYPPLTLTPQRQRQQTLDILLGWLHAEAQRQPVLVIVEDLHWIDPSMLELLGLLIDQSAQARL